jgi:two-component system sensor histidine kinase HydH
MSSAVAHSLRNPMAAIRSSAELWRSMLPQDGAGIADEIITDVDRMDSYVRDLLSYAQPEASELRAVDADAVIRQVIDKLAPTAELQGVKIAVQGRKRPVRVRADDKLLGQAITTFITNALEAMPKGGRLRVTLDRGRSRRYWQISVADTGRGIAPDVLDRVSSAYFTTKPGGLGLGLVLARGIVERFGGRMAIASTEGEGTEVRIELRAA